MDPFSFFIYRKFCANAINLQMHGQQNQQNQSYLNNFTKLLQGCWKIMVRALHSKMSLIQNLPHLLFFFKILILKWFQYTKKTRKENVCTLSLAFVRTWRAGRSRTRARSRLWPRSAPWARSRLGSWSTPWTGTRFWSGTAFGAASGPRTRLGPGSRSTLGRRTWAWSWRCSWTTCWSWSEK